MDINKALKTAATTGTLKLGSRETAKAIDARLAKLVVVAKNCREQDAILAQSKKHGVPTISFDGNNAELGAACGKPFSVACLAILDPGSSPILSGV